MYLFICLNLFVYILMIYKLSSVIRILAHYKRNSATKIHRKESQSLSSVFVLFFSFLRFVAYEVDI